MILRTLFILLLIYLLTKVISRLFLPGSSNRFGNQADNRDRQRQRYNPFFQNDQGRERQNRRKKGIKQRLDDIEDADFEDITDPTEEKDPKQG